MLKEVPTLEQQISRQFIGKMPLPDDKKIPSRKEFAEEECKQIAWKAPSEIYDAIDSGARKILVRSNNGAGKTDVLSVLVAYELKYSADVQIICSAATATQLTANLWKYVKRKLHECGIWSQCKISRQEITKDSTHICHFINPASAESGQGYHAPRVVVIIDEATKLDSTILQALMSNATGADSLIVFTYNPLDTESAIYDFEENIDKPGSEWKLFVISAFDHPNVIHGEELIPGAVTREFVQTLLTVDSFQCAKDTPEAIYLPWNETYWQPTPEALARVCGQWSVASSHGFIPGSAIIAAIKEGEIKVGISYMGMDVASSGEDKTVWSIWKGTQQIAIEVIKTGEFGLIVQKTASIIREYEISVLCIDDSGVGHAVTDRLHDIADLSCLIIPVNFAQKPKDFEKTRLPANARAEMYLCLEKEIRSKIIRPLYDQEQLKELASTKIRLSQQTEKLNIEDKKLIRRRLGRSPDKADAMALARYGLKLLRYMNQPRIL